MYGQIQQLTSEKTINSDSSMLNYLGRWILTRDEEGVYHLIKLALLKNINFNILTSIEFRDAFKYGGLDDKVIGENTGGFNSCTDYHCWKKISELLKDVNHLAILHDG